MSATTLIRKLSPEDTSALIALRREALRSEPFAFGASPEDDRGISTEFVRSALGESETQAVFGYFQDAILSGMAGIYRESRTKSRHITGVWGMYVRPEARGSGAGRQLLAAVVAHARAWPGVQQIHLSVSETAAEASRLYETMGFQVWGRQPRALQWNGRFVDETHLMLDFGNRNDC